MVEREGYEYVVCEECGAKIRGLFDAVPSQRMDDDSGENLDIQECYEEEDRYHRFLSETVYGGAR